MNKLVIFDLDGTLCDTIPDLHFYINETCKKFGYPICDLKTIRTHVCYESLTFMARCMGAEDKDTATLKKYHDFYAREYRLSKSPRTRLFPGMEETLYKLKEKGYKLAILTNKTQDQTDVIYDKYISHIGFDKVVGLRDGVVAKPDPTEIYNLMKEFNADKQNTYFIGDGDTDVLASLSAGVNLIAVTYGYRDKEVLVDLGAKVFADNPNQIYSLILGEKSI